MKKLKIFSTNFFSLKRKLQLFTIKNNMVNVTVYAYRSYNRAESLQGRNTLLRMCNNKANCYPMKH